MHYNQPHIEDEAFLVFPLERIFEKSDTPSEANCDAEKEDIYLLLKSNLLIKIALL